MSYEEDISDKLQEVYEKLGESVLRTTVDINQLHLVILSDQHRGQRDGADDFLLSMPAYNAALGYYYKAGHQLYLLGDVEELWECKHKNVFEAYRDTMRLEERFIDEDRYVRIFGNHDIDWSDLTKVEKDLKPYVPADVYEAAVITVFDGDSNLGDLYLVHGHQGTTDSDKYADMSRFIVRNVWRHFQAATKLRITTPATDFDLRQKHELAMYRWAKERGGLVLITGHTHRPVFGSQTHASDLMSRIDDKRQKLLDTDLEEDRVKIEKELCELSAELEWIRSKGDGAEIELIASDDPNSTPCFFNTGCCSFDDGDITGIEVTTKRENRGEMINNVPVIRLVRWPDDNGNPKPKILREASLVDVLAGCNL